MTYDADWFIEKIKEINQKIFIEGAVKSQKQTTLFFTSKAEVVENSYAQKFEQMRQEYQTKLIRVFEHVQEENKAVDNLMTEANMFMREESKEALNSVIDNQSIRQDVLSGIDRIIGPQKINFLRKKSTNEIAKRMTNRMFSIAEQSFDQSVSQVD